MKSKAVFALALATLLFAGCGSKVSGTYTVSILGIEGGYTFKGNKAVKFSSLSEDVTGTFAFDSKNNTITIYYDTGDTETLCYNPTSGTVSNGDISFRKR